MGYTERTVWQPISEEEFTTAIVELKLGKAPGQSKITAEMMKYMDDKIKGNFNLYY